MSRKYPMRMRCYLCGAMAPTRKVGPVKHAKTCPVRAMELAQALRDALKAGRQ